MKNLCLLYLSAMIIGCTSMSFRGQEYTEPDICYKMTYLLDGGTGKPLSLLTNRYAPFDVILTWERADQGIWYLGAIEIKDGEDAFRIENHPPDTIAWPNADRCTIRMTPSNIDSNGPGEPAAFGIDFSNTDQGFYYKPMTGLSIVDV